MIYVETNLTVHPDKAAAYRSAEKDLYAVFEKFGVKIVGSWSTIIGNSNEFTVLFAYENMGQIEKAAMAMMQDKEYQAIWQKMTPQIMSHTRKIMMPMPNSPLK